MEMKTRLERDLVVVSAVVAVPMNFGQSIGVVCFVQIGRSDFVAA